MFRIDDIGRVTPLPVPQREMGEATVPAPLGDYLFAKAGAGSEPSPQATYAVLDAAKMPFLLVSLLESSGLRHQSLFQDDAQDQMGEYAPYLVELEKDADFTRRLFTGPDGDGGLWEKDLGFFLGSAAGFDPVRRHLRKFTRLQDEHGKWFYFRFWDNVGYATPSRDADWLLRLCAAPVDWIVTRAEETMRRVARQPDAPKPSGPLVLTASWKHNIALGRHAHAARDTLSRDHRSLDRTLTPALRDEWSWHMAEAFHAYDLKRSWSQDAFVGLALVLGSRFDRDVTLPGVDEILRSDRPCHARMRDLTEETTRSIRQICGEGYSNYAAALARFAALDAAQAAQIAAGSDPLSDILDFFPEKARTLSQEQRRRLTARCNAVAVEAFAPADRRQGAVLLFAHAFLLGEGSLDDPLHDYLRRILRSDATDKIDQLFRYGRKRAAAQLRNIRKLNA